MENRNEFNKKVIVNMSKKRRTVSKMNHSIHHLNQDDFVYLETCTQHGQEVNWQENIGVMENNHLVNRGLQLSATFT